ncbi:MAG TPA: transcriptional regulator [Firmicutes bacterium]|nr:transcriptional regulator [Bacillota bacterium]
MDLIRIGDKLLSRRKIINCIDRILELRSSGKSQIEVANELAIDRAWISRLESMGEVRKGGRVAVIGFPVQNPAELQQVAVEEEVEFHLLLTDEERWRWAAGFSGADMFNRLMEMIISLKDFDTVIFLGSDMRIRLVEAILGRDMVIGVELGTSPIKGDVYVSPAELRQMIKAVKGR